MKYKSRVTGIVYIITDGDKADTLINGKRETSPMSNHDVKYNSNFVKVN